MKDPMRKNEKGRRLLAAAVDSVDLWLKNQRA